MNREKLNAGTEILKEALVIIGTVVDIAGTVFDGLSLFGIEPKNKRTQNHRQGRRYDPDHNNYHYDYDDCERAIARYEYEAERARKSREVISRLDAARERRHLEGAS